MTTHLSPAPVRPPVASAEDPYLDRAAMNILEDTCAGLAQAGWSARVVVADLCGEPEARLALCSGDGSTPRVELLGPCDTALIPQRWHAVRVDAGERIVWRGPAHPCPSGALIAFLEFLLRPDAGAVPGRYDPLG